MEDLIFDNILDATFIVDDSNKVIYCNEAASALLDVSARRMQKAESFSQLIELSSEQPMTLPGGEGDIDQMQAYVDVEYKTTKGKEGQGLFFITAYQGNWLIFLREMTIETDLHYGYKEQLEAKEKVIEELKEAQAQLKEYNENLEKIVAQRTEELRESNAFLSTMIDSLGQGLLVFDQKGDCHPTYTKVCDQIYEQTPSQNKVWDLIPNEPFLEGWVGQIFEAILPIEDVLALGPNHFQNKKGREIELEFLPMKRFSDDVDSIVLVATDKTDEYQAKKLAQSREKYAERILKVSSNKEQFFGFVNDCRIILDDIRKKKVDIEQTYRDVHSMKGAAAMFSLEDLEDAAHHTESILSDFRSGEDGDQQAFEDSFSRLEQAFLDTVGEFRQIVGDALDYHQRKVEIPFFKLQNYSKKLALELGENASLTVELIKEFIHRPAKSFLKGYDDMIQNICGQFGKQVYPVEWINGDLAVCPNSYSDLFKSMVHIFRNAIAHGIETPEERTALGKDKKGAIRVEFKEISRKKGKFLRIIVSDDGKGIQSEIIKNKLKELDKDTAGKSDHQIIQHIFDMDFSTSGSIDNLSGRGVGLSAVKIEVEKLKGDISVYSECNIGTQFEIEFPISGGINE